MRETSLFVLKRGERMEKEVLEKLRQPIQEIVSSADLLLYDLSFVHEDGNDFLRVSIEKKYLTMDFASCEIISSQVSQLLDQLDPIDHPYILEVCSPGAERPLITKQDFVDAIHSYVHLYFHQSVQQKEDLKGEIVSINEDLITITYKEKTRNKTITIPYNNIKKAHLAIKF